MKGRAALLLAVCASAVAASAGAAPSAPAGPVFSGTGGKSLPLFRVKVPSTLRWTSSVPAFQLFPKRGTAGGTVSAKALSGATYLEPGSYRLDLLTRGAWTVRVAAGIERPRPLGGGLVGFRGNGARDLPPFTTRQRTSLVWTNSGTTFEVTSNDFSVAVSSHAKRGRSTMVAGRQRLSVNAVGTWTVGWKPS